MEELEREQERERERELEQEQERELEQELEQKGGDMKYILLLITLLWATPANAESLYACGRAMQRSMGSPVSDTQISNILMHGSGNFKYLIGIAMIESRMRPDIQDSSAGAIGMFQLMPGTAKAMQLRCSIVDGPRNHAANIKMGACYLDYMLEKAGGDVDAAVAAYNCGPRCILKVQNYRTLPMETANYLWKFQKLLNLVECR